MARIKGGMNAKKKHNRTLKLAKGIQRSSFQTVQSCKTVCNESTHHLLTQEENSVSVR